ASKAGSATGEVVGPLAVEASRWYFACAGVDAGTGQAWLAMGAVGGPTRPSTSLQIERAQLSVPWSPPTHALVGAAAPTSAPVRHFNGKVDSPRTFGRSLEESEVAALASGAEPRSIPGLASAWCFDPVLASTTGSAPDAGPMRADGQLVNLPTLGVT